jgi:hypothetical protein
MRYHFNIRDMLGVIPDEEGSDLAGIKAARQEAIATARDFAMDDLRCGGPVRALSIEITDEDGMVLETVAVSDIVAMRPN